MTNLNFDNFLSTPVKKEFIDILKYECTSPLADIILTRSYYKKNIELREFTTEFLKEDYRDYLFSARPTLYAKVVRDIFVAAEKDEEKAIQKLNGLKDFLGQHISDSSLETKSDKTKPKKNSNASTLRGWSNIINPKGSTNDGS